MAAEPPSSPAASEAELAAELRHLSGIERASASAGEREAAEWIAARLREHGCRDARVEEEPAHGTYWWPLGMLSALSTALGLWALRHPGRARGPVGALGALAAWAMGDDVSAGRFWFRKRFLPRRTTYNVVAEAGEADAPRTIVLVAHHDAAHTGLIFDPRLAPIGDRFPDRPTAHESRVSAMVPVVAAPALVGLGAALAPGRFSRALTGLGTIVSTVCVAVFADVGRRGVVPGANDNASGVVALLELARALGERPVTGVRVLLVSTGSEESFMEGMKGFSRRHFPHLAPESTWFLGLDAVGSQQLVLYESVGMLFLRDYPAAFKDLVGRCAEEAGVELMRGIREAADTDCLIPLRAGYPTTMIASIDSHEEPSNYHWPTDTPENVDLGSVAGAARLSEAVVRRLADWPPPGPRRT